ncbi:MAG: hypothetical protein MUO60_07550, partial [Clostridiaceae bacterium]|nr:hypothetical protein [Clostridiaceae bacterium]
FDFILFSFFIEEKRIHYINVEIWNKRRCMDMSKKEKGVEVLNNLDSESKMPTGTNLNIDEDKYGNLINEVLDEELISNTFYNLVKGHMS